MFWYFILGCVVVAMTVLCGKCVRMSRAMMMMREECIQHQRRALEKRVGPGGAGFPHGNPQAQLAAMSRLLFLCDQLSKHPELATSKTIFEEVTSVATGSGLCSGNKAANAHVSVHSLRDDVRSVHCIGGLRGLHWWIACLLCTGTWAGSRFFVRLPRSFCSCIFGYAFVV